MGVGGGGAIALSREPPDNHLRPAVSFLFRSIAEACGPSAVGVLLTGMGRDGAEALKTMKERGAVTIAQDRESCAVNGMPGAAIELGAAAHVLAPERIAQTLIKLSDPNGTPTDNTS
jgi:two-component system chemotaxis response regulator CheB